MIVPSGFGVVGLGFVLFLHRAIAKLSLLGGVGRWFGRGVGVWGGVGGWCPGRFDGRGGGGGGRPVLRSG